MRWLLEPLKPLDDDAATGSIKAALRAVRAAERVAVAAHEGAHAERWREQLRSRLSTLASEAQVEAAQAQASGRGVRSSLAVHAAAVVPQAARGCKRRHAFE